MTQIVVEIVVIFCLILLNGLLSMSELAMMTARKQRLVKRAEQGDQNAIVALDLKQHPDRFLSTVQIGITLIGILSGAVAGATLAKTLGTWLENFAIFRDRGESVAVVLVVIAITYLSLLFGELIPKQIALSSSENVASFMARPMRFLAKISSPLVWLLSTSSNAILGLLRLKDINSQTVLEEEVRFLLKEGRATGEVEESEQEIIERTFKLGDRAVSSIMTSRVDIVWLDSEQSFEENFRRISGSPHHFFPLCKGKLQEVVGVISVKDLLVAQASQSETDLLTLATEPMYVIGSMNGLRLLDSFRNGHRTMALVVDELGNISGLVTINDLLEAVVGDMPSVNPEGDITLREDGTWLVEGLMPIEDFLEYFELSVAHTQHLGRFSTVAGFVIAKLGKLPALGDHCVVEGHRIEVIDMDGQRVDKLLVERIS